MKERDYEVHIYMGGQFVADAIISATSYEAACVQSYDLRAEVLDRDRVADEEDED